MADDGKVIMKPSRFETFKKKYASYRKIYDKKLSHTLKDREINASRII